MEAKMKALCTKIDTLLLVHFCSFVKLRFFVLNLHSSNGSFKPASLKMKASCTKIDTLLLVHFCSFVKLSFCFKTSIAEMEAKMKALCTKIDTLLLVDFLKLRFCFEPL